MGQVVLAPGSEARDLWSSPGSTRSAAGSTGTTFPDLGTGAGASNSYGFYVQGQQMLLRQGGLGSARGLTVVGSVHLGSLART